ncbi:MAG: sulfatase/phosphatase domain-containing protein, partial [Actinomycetota bacterium]
FTSDNGYSAGEHRWVGKVAPYEEDIRVPLIIRYGPAAAAAERDIHMVTNVDLAPTFAELAGVRDVQTEGQSLLPLLRGSPVAWRDDVMVEAVGGSTVSGYCLVHDGRFKLVRYVTGEEELYDLRADPYELDNRVGDPTHAAAEERLSLRLRQLCRKIPAVPTTGED